MPWPPITEPVLRERLAMDDEEHEAFVAQLWADLPPRRYTRAVLATALGYPWPKEPLRPPGEPAPPPRGERALGDDAAPLRRFPLLAFGSNAAPATLARKLAHLPANERAVSAVPGVLHDFDVGASAHLTAYGALPASLFASPGTAVGVSVLRVSAAQLTQLCWTEPGYRFGRLDDVRLTLDAGDESPTSVLAFLSRAGTFCPDGEPLVLSAVAATGRRAGARKQEQLLDRAARLTLGDEANAEALVRAVFEAPSTLADRPLRRLRAAGRPLTPPAWTLWTPLSVRRR